MFYDWHFGEWLRWNENLFLKSAFKTNLKIAVVTSNLTTNMYIKINLESQSKEVVNSDLTLLNEKT